MLTSPFAKFLDTYINDQDDEHVKAELQCLKESFVKAAKKNCPYCKWVGHTRDDCPVFKELKSRCAGSGLREKIRGRISNNLCLDVRLPISAFRGRRGR